MRIRGSRIRIAAGALVAAAVLVAIGSARLRAIDADAARRGLESRLESALGLPVELGAAVVSLLPVPELRIRDVRIGDTQEFRLDAPELVAGLEPGGLFGGEASVRAILLVAPRLRVSADAAAVPPRDARPTADAQPVGVRLPLALRVRDGVLEMGAVRLEGIALTGEVTGAPHARFELTAALPGLARIEECRLEVVGLGEPASRWRWSATARVADVDLDAAGERLALAGVRGRAAGTLAAAGRGGAPERASLELDSGDLELAGPRHRVSGRTLLSVQPGGEVAIDLLGATLRVGESFEKPAGAALRITGRVAAPGLRLRDLRIDSDALRAEGELDLAEQTLTLRSGTLDLAALPDRGVPEGLPRGGRVEITGARIAGDPPALHATGELVEVQVPLTSRAVASVSGPVSTDGSRVSGTDLRAVVAEEAIRISGHYAWAEPHVELVASVRGAQLAPLAGALWGRFPMSGRVYARVELAGRPDPLALSGSGEFEVQGGELPGISLARAAGVGPGTEDPEPEGLDRFERLAGIFTLAGDRLEVRDLALVQEHATAALSGDFHLRERAPDLAGMVRFAHPDLPEVIVRPILRVAGTLDALETHVSDAGSEEVANMEALMLEAIRKAEAERRAARGSGS
jgi:hypothetical protein